MKRMWGIIAIVGMLSVYHTGLAAEINLNIQDGVSDIPWGAGPDSVKQPVKDFRKGDILYIKKPGEAFAYKGIDLGAVLYGFYQDRFFAAYMRIRSEDDADKLMQIFDSEFGPVRRQLRVNETVYIWDSQDIKIKLKKLLNQKLFKLSFYYTPLSNKLNEIRMDKNSEITMDLVPSK